MDTRKLTNPSVKAAIDAWQKGDRKTFLSFFTNNAKLFDYSSPRDFKKFIDEACGHERFIGIDKVENNGLDVYGEFHTEAWGDFKTYFKFSSPEAAGVSDGKFDQLEIGQAHY